MSQPEKSDAPVPRPKQQANFKGDAFPPQSNRARGPRKPHPVVTPVVEQSSPKRLKKVMQKEMPDIESQQEEELWGASTFYELDWKALLSWGLLVFFGGVAFCLLFHHMMREPSAMMEMAEQAASLVD